MSSNVSVISAPLGFSSPVSAAAANTLDRTGYLALCAFTCAIPWGAGYSVGPFLVADWLGLIAFVAVALRTLISGRIRKPKDLHYALLVFAAWSMLSVFWSWDGETTATLSATYLQMLIAVWLVWELATTENRVTGLLQSFVLGGLFSSVSVLYNFFSGKTTAQLSAEAGLSEWDTGRYSIGGVNANDLGLMLALSVPMVFFLFTVRRGWLVKALCWLQLMTGLTAIFLTGSRGALFAVIVALIMLPLTFSRLSRGQKVATVLACAGLTAAGLYLVPSTSWLRLFSIGEEISQGTLTHRTILWTAGLDVFRGSPFLGVGLGAFGFAISSVADYSYAFGSAVKVVAHNTFLSVLVELGVVGALLFLFLITESFYCALQMSELRRRLWIILLTVWCVGVFSLSWEHQKTTWLLFGLLISHASCQRTE